jgi:hypothetical protein
MHTKLTLRLGVGLIDQAKKHARKSGKSLSQMVADYFQSVLKGLGKPERQKPITPLVSALKGRLKGAKINVHDYERHLEEKYG